MKTISLKKVSAVAVASLGFGLLSVVPATAANNAAIKADSINLTTYTTTPATGAAVKVNQGQKMVAGVTPGATDTTSFSGYLSTYPANGQVSVVPAITCADGATAATLPTGLGGTATVTGGTLNLTGTAGGATATNATAVTSSSTACTGSWSFTPTVAGSYVLTVFQDSNANGSKEGSEIVKDIAITVTAAADLSVSLSTAYMTEPSANGATASSTTNAVKRTAAKAANTGIAQILVTLNKSGGTADTQAHVVTATVTGVGFVAVDTTANTPGTPTTRTETDNAAASVRYVHINSDGTAGTGSVTVTVQNVTTLVTSTLGTWSYSSFGDTTKLEVSKVIFSIGLAGGDSTGQASTTRNSTGEVTNAGALNNSTTTPAFIVKATDSSGGVSHNATPTIVSSDTLVVASGSCANDGGADATYSSGGTGFYNCAFVTAASAKSGDKATLTIRIVDPADATKYLTTTTAVTVGGTVSKETLTFDKTAYVAGEGMVVTRTATDASNNPVADGTASPAVTFNKTVGGTAPAAGLYVAGKSSTSATTPTVFAPATPGSFTASMTSGNAAGEKVSGTSAVTDPNAALLTQVDALNAKIVALNALIAKIMKKLGVK